MKVFGINDGSTRAGSAVHRLLDAASRLEQSRGGRAMLGRVAVVVHLSRLRPPAPRPHHRRIARAVLQDSADRHDGQLFDLANGDLVLLSRAGAGAVADGASLQQTMVAEPEMVPTFIGRLLQADSSQCGELVSLWPLETDLASLVAYAQTRAREDGLIAWGAPDHRIREDLAVQTDLVHTTAAALADLADTAAIGDLLQRQTAILVADGAEGAGNRLRPLFREIGFAPDALDRLAESAAPGLAARAGGGRVADDPALFRHVAMQFDQAVFSVLSAERGGGGPLDIGRTPGVDVRAAAPVHVGLTLPVILSEGFDRFADACRKAGVRVGVQVNVIEAVADVAQFRRAGAALKAVGFGLVLDGVSHLTWLLCRPWLLQPDLVKLEWSAEMAALAESEQRQLWAGLADFGPRRIVLCRADTEAALRWGVAQGIRRFQGRHVDAMLAASRMLGCRSAGCCTVIQCQQRAAAPRRGGGGWCDNPNLLDGLAAPLLGDVVAARSAVVMA